MPEGFEDWSGRTFRTIDLTGARFKETILVNARFSGLITGLVVNDIEVAPLIAAEMDRRFPERLMLRPSDAAGVREAWGVIEHLWEATKARAANLPDDVLQLRHEDDEWSWAEHFRHLVFVTDGWITVNALGRAPDRHPWGVPPSFITDVPGIDVDARPAWAEIVPVRESRMQIVRELADGLTDDDLAVARRGSTVLECVHVVLDEEWHHNWYANRDLPRRGQ